MILSFITTSLLDGITMTKMQDLSTIYDRAGFYEQPDREDEPQYIDMSKYIPLYMPESNCVELQSGDNGIELKVHGNNGFKLEFDNDFTKYLITTYGKTIPENTNGAYTNWTTRIDPFKVNEIQRVVESVDREHLDPQLASAIIVASVCSDLGLAEGLDYRMTVDQYGGDPFASSHDIENKEWAFSAAEVLRHANSLNRNSGIEEKEVYLSALAVAVAHSDGEQIPKLSPEYYETLLSEIDYASGWAQEKYEMKENPFDKEQARAYLSDEEFCRNLQFASACLAEHHYSNYGVNENGHIVTRWGTIVRWEREPNLTFLRELSKRDLDRSSVHVQTDRRYYVDRDHEEHTTKLHWASIGTPHDHDSQTWLTREIKSFDFSIYHHDSHSWSLGGIRTEKPYEDEIKIMAHKYVDVQTNGFKQIELRYQEDKSTPLSKEMQASMFRARIQEALETALRFRDAPKVVIYADVPKEDIPNFMGKLYGTLSDQKPFIEPMDDWCKRMEERGYKDVGKKIQIRIQPTSEW